MKKKQLVGAIQLHVVYSVSANRNALSTSYHSFYSLSYLFRDNIHALFQLSQLFKADSGVFERRPFGALSALNTRRYHGNGEWVVEIKDSLLKKRIRRLHLMTIEKQHMGS